MTFLNSKLQIQTLNNVTLCLKMTVLFVNLQCSILPKNPKVSSKATALAMKSLKYFQDVRILWQSGDTQNSHIVCLGRPKQGMKYKYYAKYAIHHFPLHITFDWIFSIKFLRMLASACKKQETVNIRYCI